MSQEKNEKYYLSIAGFIIEVDFGEAEQVLMRRQWISNFKEMWGESGLLVSRPEQVHFVFKFKSRSGKEIGIKLGRDGRSQYILQGVWGRNNKEAHIYYEAGMAVFLAYLKQALLRLLVSSGFIIHASSVEIKGKTFVFMAVSGGGKSTTRKMLMSHGARYVGDDAFIARKVDGKWRYYGSPFIEKEHKPVDFEPSNARFFFVKKDTNIKIIKITDKVECLERMLEQVWLVENKVEKEQYEKLIEFVQENDFNYLHASLDSDKLMEALK